MLLLRSQLKYFFTLGHVTYEIMARRTLTAVQSNKFTASPGLIALLGTIVDELLPRSFNSDSIGFPFDK
jgi:hypothetical protein